MSFTHDEYALAVWQLSCTAEMYLEEILRLEAEFSFCALQFIACKRSSQRLS